MAAQNIIIFSEDEEPTTVDEIFEIVAETIPGEFVRADEY